MTIIVVRHGETRLNAARVIQPADAALSPRGEEQARRVAERLRAEHPAAVVSSDLLRARTTAERIAAAAARELQLEPLLQERSLGELRGTPYADLTQDVFAPDFVPPGGESWAQFDERVDRAWETLCKVRAQLDGPLVAVTHGLLCRSLARRRLRLPEGGPAPTWGNTCVTIVTAAPPYTVQVLSCTGHLADETRGGQWG